MTGSTGGERGAVAVLAVVVVGMILLLGVASLDINAVVSARNRSQTAADAAALAVTPATFHCGFYASGGGAADGGRNRRSLGLVPMSGRSAFGGEDRVGANRGGHPAVALG